VTTDDEAARRAAWLAHYPEGRSVPATPSPAPHMTVLALLILWIALAACLSSLGIIADLAGLDGELGFDGYDRLTVAGYAFGSPAWAVLVAPLAVATLAASLQFLRRGRARPLAWAIGGWVVLAAVLDEPIGTRLTLVLVLLVVAGALVHAIRGASSSRAARDLRYPSGRPGR